MSVSIQDLINTKTKNQNMINSAPPLRYHERNHPPSILYKDGRCTSPVVAQVGQYSTRCYKNDEHMTRQMFKSMSPAMWACRGVMQDGNPPPKGARARNWPCQQLILAYYVVYAAPPGQDVQCPRTINNTYHPMSLLMCRAVVKIKQSNSEGGCHCVRCLQQLR